TLRHFVDVHLHVVLGIPVVVHVVDVLALLVLHLDNHHPAAVLITLGVVVTLVVVVFRDDGRAAVIALVLSSRSRRELGSHHAHQGGEERQIHSPLLVGPPL